MRTDSDCARKTSQRLWSKHEKQLGGESYLDVGHAERCQTGDARSGNAWRLKVEHCLEADLQIRDCGRHVVRNCSRRRATRDASICTPGKTRSGAEMSRYGRNHALAEACSTGEQRREEISQCGVSFLAALFGTKVQNPFTRSRLVKCTRAKSLRCRYDRRQTSGVRYGTTCAREKLFYCCVRSATRSQDAE